MRAYLLATILSLAAATDPKAKRVGHVLAHKQAPEVAPKMTAPAVRAARTGPAAKTTTVKHEAEKKVAKKAFVKQEPEPAAEAAPAEEVAAPAEPEAPSDVVPPLSTTSYCIISLLTQFFVLYTGLVIVRNFNTYSGAATSWVQQLLEEGTTTVNLAPMMCVLFLTARYRAYDLTGGHPDSAGLPQDWVKTAMKTATWGILAQFILVLLRGTLSKILPEGALGMMGLRYLVIAAILGGTGTVCWGVLEMHVEGAARAISPTVECVMILTVMYFAVVISLEIARSIRQISVGEDASADPQAASVKVESWLNMATQTMSLAPMLALLFLAARMHALQLGLEGPAEWTTTVFHSVTYSLLSATLLTILVPAAFGGKVRRGLCEGDIIFEMESSSLFAVLLSALRHLMTFVIYGGFISIVVSMFILHNPSMAETPALSTAAHCIVQLVNMYFGIFGLMWVLLTVKQFVFAGRAGESSQGGLLNTLIQGCDAARSTIMFAPMLSVLFIAARLRALEVSDGKGAPQQFAQQAMMVATIAVSTQVFFALLGPLAGLKVEIDSDGTVSAPKDSSGWMKHLIAFLGFAAMVSMYGGACAVIYSLFSMSPATTLASVFF